MADNLSMALAELLRKADAEPDIDTLRKGLRVMTQALMELEVAQHLGAERYQRTPERQGERNGYRDRHWDTRVGSLELRVPRVRDGSFFPGLLEPRKRAERALVASVREPYVQGVSTRRVDDLVKALGLEGISKSQVTELLVRLVADDEPHHLHAELVQHALQATGTEAGQLFGPGQGRRTVQQLLAAAAQRTQAHERAAAARAEQERQRQDRERATARAMYLDSLVERVEEEWQRVDELVVTRRPTDYDTAVQVLRDLRELADRGGPLDNFAARFEQLRARHAKKVGLLERLTSARLLHEQIAVSRTGPRAREM
jgi:hypothetical protein